MKRLREDAAEGDGTAAALVEAVESEEGAATRCVEEMDRRLAVLRKMEARAREL